MLSIHLHVVGRLPAATPKPFSWQGRDWATFSQDSVASLSVSFDEAVERLGRLSRMFVEPDGSFLWSSPRGTTPVWRLDGDMREVGATLRHVTLSGTCPRPEFLAVIDCLRVGDEPLLFELASEGLRLGLDEVVAYCAAGGE